MRNIIYLLINKLYRRETGIKNYRASLLIYFKARRL